MSLSHQDRLLLYCRLCGRRTIPDSPRPILCPVSAFRESLRKVHGESEGDLEGSDDVHPRFVCHECDEKFRKKDEQGKDMIQKISEAHKNRSKDPDVLVRLARFVPLAEFWAHGAMGCQVCEDDEFFGAEETVAAVEKVKKWKVVEEGKEGATEVAEIAVLARRTGRDSKAKSAILAEMFRTMGKRNQADIVKELRSFGVSFSNPPSENPVATNVKMLAEKALEQVNDLAAGERAHSVVGAILDELDAECLEKVGIGIDRDNAKLLETFGTGKIRFVRRKNPVASSNGSVVTSSSLQIITLDKESRGGGDSPDTKKGTNKSATTLSRNGRPGPLSAKKSFSSSSSSSSPSTTHDSNPRGPKMRISSKALEVLKRKFHSQMPTDRFARADIVRFILASCGGQKLALLKRVGITFDCNSGGYLQGRAVFNEARAKGHAEKLSHLIDVQWAVVMAEATFKLLDPKETRSLELTGISVDPENPKTPLFYRLERAARRELARAALGTGETGTLAGRVVGTFDLAGTPSNVRAVEVAFGISNKEAEEFIDRGRRQVDQQKEEGTWTEQPSRSPSTTPPKRLPAKPSPSSKSPRLKLLPPGVSVTTLKRKGSDDPGWTSKRSVTSAAQPRRSSREVQKKSFAELDSDEDDEIVELDS